jgi:hypothetical protein
MVSVTFLTAMGGSLSIKPYVLQPGHLIHFWHYKYTKT